MSSLKLKVEVRSSTSLTKACEDAIDLAGKLGITIVFEFQGIELYATGISSVFKIEDDFKKKSKPLTSSSNMH
jgi:hypothetical protein